MKINVNKTTEEHMEAHRSEFLSEWKILLSRCTEKNEVKTLTKDFEIIELKFDEAIGYKTLLEVTSQDTIYYAKRKGRDIHSRFVKNKSPLLCDTLTLILKKDRRAPETYNLITMFVGSPNFKEPEDLNIYSKSELIESLNFWSKHAFVYDETVIDVTSVKTICPYKNLYFVTAA